MGTARERQVRSQEKRRRREERQKRRLASASSPQPEKLEWKWAQTAVLTPDGRPPDPKRLAAHVALGPMSDALLELMKPYVRWPPAPDELEDVEGWLELGAAVWNATLRATTALQLRDALAALVNEFDLQDEADPVALVEEIAVRKLRLFVDDYRFVGGVRVRAEGKNATVEAASFAHLR